MFKVSEEKIIYNSVPKNLNSYTDKMDKEYDVMSKFYNFFMFIFPFWKIWISSVIPYISKNTVLDISFGPGYLLKKISKKFNCYGIDYNRKMVNLTKKQLEKKGLTANLSQGNVNNLPFESNTFDTVINTMALSGYPDGKKALNEMIRVLKPGKQLLLVDFDYPINRNIFGYLLVKIMQNGGDLIKDIESIVKSESLVYQRKQIGGFGSVWLYIIKKPL